MHRISNFGTLFAMYGLIYGPTTFKPPKIDQNVDFGAAYRELTFWRGVKHTWILNFSLCATGSLRLSSYSRRFLEYCPKAIWDSRQKNTSQFTPRIAAILYNYWIKKYVWVKGWYLYSSTKFDNSSTCRNGELSKNSKKWQKTKNSTL